jgi:16S rRNA U516 pseudouridylate synthase RsuA-like enzyme
MLVAEALELPVEDNFPAPAPGTTAHSLWEESHVRRRRNKPTHFLRTAIQGGKNRQVRVLV